MSTAVLCHECDEERAIIRVSITDMDGVLIGACAIGLQCAGGNSLTAFAARRAVIVGDDDEVVFREEKR